MKLAAGAVFAEHYRIVRPLGEGGYGRVYLAEEFESRPEPEGGAGALRTIALKMLRAEHFDERRYLTELRALCQLTHPNIVTVYRYGRAPCAWFAMEYVAGRTLAELADAGEASLPSLLELLAGVADGLHHAHARGIIHRDLKPHNILVPDEGPPRILDFGLSLFIDPSGEASTRIGTPGYLAPELLSPNEAGTAPCDHRVDIYALGATICAVLTGESPFAAPGVMATITNQVHGRFQLPASMPEHLASLVRRCLDNDPLARPSTAGAVADELRHIARTLPGTRSQRIPSPDGRVTLLDVRVQEPVVHRHSERPHAKAFVVEGRGASADEERRSGVFVHRGDAGSASARLYDSLAACWEGAELSIHHASPTQAADGRPVLRLDGASALVLDPYFPVSVTDVLKVDGSRAGPCASRMLVDLREATASNRHLIMGGVAHEIFETLARFALGVSDDEAFDLLFEQAIARRRFDLLAAGMCDDDVTRLASELREHFTALVEWTRPDANTRRGAITEATRFSPRLGLDGRIDLALVEDGRLRIVELKTGRREQGEHRSQVQCYAALWSAAAAADGRTIEGHVLYSATHRAVEVDVDTTRIPVEIGARNLAVAARRWHSHGDSTAHPPSFGDDPLRCNDSPCRFRRSTCETQSRLLGNLAGRDVEQAPIDPETWGSCPADVVRATRLWYFHFVSLVEREYRAASEAYSEIFRSEGLAQRVESLRAIEGARIEAVDAANQQVLFTVRNRGVLNAGDNVLLHRACLETAPTLRGRVDEASFDRVLVDVPGIEGVAHLPQDGWFMEREEPRIGFREMHRALWAMVASRDEARLRLLVQPAIAAAQLDGAARAAGARRPAEPAPAPRSGQVVECDRAPLNDDQRRAAEAAAALPPLLLIQGPPGTGKTGVIAEIALQAVLRGERVLLAAQTHAAVDTALARVLAAGARRVLRVGNPRRATSDLEQGIARAGLDPERVYSDELGAASPSLDVLRQALDAVDVVAATTHACQSHHVFACLTKSARTTSGRPFDLVIVDEAAQLTEPAAIAAWMRADRLVLVGDDRQLPPVVRSTEAHGRTLTRPVHPLLQAAGVQGLDRSLFERLRPFFPPVMLSTQYRMSEEIQRFSSAAFYAGALRAAPHVRARRLPLQPGWRDALDDELARRLDPERPLVWVDAHGTCQGNTNPCEADELVRTVLALAERWHPDDGETPWSRIGIVSPYRAQCHAIRSRLREQREHERVGVEIDTVERFQGREKEVILVSLVERDWNEFVMDARRLNVTFTRARSKLIVFGRRDIGRRMQEIWLPG